MNVDDRLRLSGITPAVGTLQPLGLLARFEAPPEARVFKVAHTVRSRKSLDLTVPPRPAPSLTSSG